MCTVVAVLLREPNKRKFSTSKFNDVRSGLGTALVHGRRESHLAVGSIALGSKVINVIVQISINECVCVREKERKRIV